MSAITNPSSPNPDLESHLPDGPSSRDALLRDTAARAAGNTCSTLTKTIAKVGATAIFSSLLTGTFNGIVDKEDWMHIVLIDLSVGLVSAGVASAVVLTFTEKVRPWCQAKGYCCC